MKNRLMRIGRLACLVGAAGLLAGCSAREESTPEAKVAQEALGIKNTKEVETNTKVDRSVIVEQETKVIDPKTGAILSDTTKTTPVTITREKEVRTDVSVDVGKTQANP